MVATMSILVVVTITRPLAGQPFVTTSGGEFRVCDQTLKFMGFNVRGICHFGRGDVLPFSSTADIATNLDYCVNAESRVIRVFCAANTIGPVATGDRLEVVLDACEARGMWVIVALTDMYSVTNMHPQGDSVYYTVPGSGYQLLNHTFFSSGYTVNYLPQALYLADRFKDHPALFAWQIGNELRDLSSGDTFVAFCHDVANQIRSVDPNHLISAGIIGWRVSNLNFVQAAQLYSAMDFVGTHNYHGDDYNNDAGMAAEFDIPYIIDEAGFDSNIYGPDRTPETDADIAKWLARGVDGYMNWGLMATSYDNGDGDRVVGVDPVFHAADFFAYSSLFASYGQTFALTDDLEVEPAWLEAVTVTGADPADDTFAVRAGSGGTVSFSVNDNANWLSASPISGTTDCMGTDVTVDYQVTGLGPGTYTAQITVTAPGVPGSPQYVDVILVISGNPGDFDGDEDVDMDDHGTFQLCLTGPGAPQSDPTCLPARLDQDVDVDQDDAAIFAQCLSGANVPSDPGCAG